MTFCRDKVSIAGLVLVSACTHATPREDLMAYADALRARDENRVRDLSDEKSRALWTADPGAFEEDWTAVAARLDKRVVRVEKSARLHLEGGHVVDMAYEGDGWRVSSGGLSFVRADTPTRALASFMAAYDAGRFDVLRAFIPRRFLSAYATDEAVKTRLSAMTARIEGARPALSVSRPAVEGDYARIPYGQGRAVELVLEDGTWRVLDLE